MPGLQCPVVVTAARAVTQNVVRFVVTQATSAKYNLKKMSDLAPVANQLVLGGPATAAALWSARGCSFLRLR